LHLIQHIPLPEVGVGGGIEAKEHVDLIATIKSTALFLIGIGIFFGTILALVAKKFSVKMDPRIEKVREVLAGAQCGACGYAGCQAYAEAVVLNPDVPPNLCIPGKEEVAEAVARITGKSMVKLEKRIARVLCQGGSSKAGKRFVYEGVKDCRAVILAGGGDKMCLYGCLGYGTCASVCPFDAIEMSSDNLPIIDPEKCTACGKCAAACPKKIIEIMPESKAVLISCSSKDKGSDTRKYCSVGCIGCRACERVCPFNAAHVEDNLSKIDANKCKVCGLCVKKCPTGAIVDFLTERGRASVMENCIGCGLCVRICPVNAASGEKKKRHYIDTKRCIGCGICVERCPVTAISGTFNYQEVAIKRAKEKAEVKHKIA
ncbi:MAG: Fe-S cluster domain-containing protein, partial [Nitrospirae bacterium]